mmetsp:Transcript_29256/g.40192  ORF Transcript_29256/g.40192 Transcript_29256/m.40192 type:complete len:243 (-) Transcript_29256:1015-1743(-)
MWVPSTVSSRPPQRATAEPACPAAAAPKTEWMAARSSKATMAPGPMKDAPSFTRKRVPNDPDTLIRLLDPAKRASSTSCLRGEEGASSASVKSTLCPPCRSSTSRVRAGSASTTSSRELSRARSSTQVPRAGRGIVAVAVRPWGSAAQRTTEHPPALLSMGCESAEASKRRSALTCRAVMAWECAVCSRCTHPPGPSSVAGAFLNTTRWLAALNTTAALPRPLLPLEGSSSEPGAGGSSSAR